MNEFSEMLIHVKIVVRNKDFYPHFQSKIQGISFQAESQMSLTISIENVSELFDKLQNYEK